MMKLDCVAKASTRVRVPTAGLPLSTTTSSIDTSSVRAAACWRLLSAMSSEETRFRVQITTLTCGGAICEDVHMSTLLAQNKS
ncbi:hypothetical protein ASG32_23700 [Methylobacterium sp. Leaf361]|nr:hypothetical protein ASG32_23700 [Methylobacterium sp. Leaf361]